MNKIIVMMLLALSYLSGCSNDMSEDYEYAAEGTNLTVTFSLEPESRAFFDGNPRGEVWERKINNVQVILCDRNGQMWKSWTLTAQQISSATFKFPAENMMPEQGYQIYLIANYPGQPSFSSLNRDINDYNGTYQVLSQRCAAAEGFTMIGTGIIRTTHTQTNPLKITLYRTVSKVELKFEISPQMYTQYPSGVMVITKAKIKGIKQSPVLFNHDQEDQMIDIVQNSFQQISGKEYRNIFYVYSTVTGNQPVEIDVNGEFYPNGISAGGGIPMEYTFTPPWSNGRIAANTYYRISATIKSPTDISINYDVSVVENPLMYDGCYTCYDVIIGKVQVTADRPTDYSELKCYVEVKSGFRSDLTVNGGIVNNNNPIIECNISSTGFVQYVVEYLQGWVFEEDLEYDIVVTDGKDFTHRENFKHVTLNKLTLFYNEYPGSTIEYWEYSMVEKLTIVTGYDAGVVIWFNGPKLRIRHYPGDFHTLWGWIEPENGVLSPHLVGGSYSSPYNDYTLGAEYR